MIAAGNDLITSAPLLTIIPGTMILLTVLSLNVFGDGLRDALDPKIEGSARGARRHRRARGHGGLMGRFVVRRLLGTLAVLFAVSVIVFLIFNVIPNSDPARRLAGRNPSPQLVASIKEEWGFDDPLPQQYLTTMGKIFNGDLISYTTRENVDERIVEGIPATFSLCIGAAAIWMFFGILFGYLSAVRAGGWLDRTLTMVAVAGISIPVFWLAAILLNYLSYETDLFPSGEYVALTADPLEWASHLILPWFTLAIPSRLLQPRSALQHARRDERGLRPHRARQGPRASAG